MKRNSRWLLALFTMLFVILPFATSASAEPLEDMRQLIRDYYVDDVPESVLMKNTALEITKQLDPYSVYMTAQEYQGFINGIEQRIIGIGIVLEEDVKGIKVTSVIPKGPAERAGILAGDVITHVGTQSLVGKSAQTAVSWIGGQENTVVMLTIERPGQTQPLLMRITREVITMANVESTMLGGSIGYIRLNSFATESAKEVNAAIRSMHGAKGWIVDFRNNGGGYISVAQDITGFFPNAVGAFQLREKTGKPQTYKAISQPYKFTVPTHLLMNGYSASASEMVAAAVKEQKLATIYGQTSYGKGSMQSMFHFTDDSVLKLTTARFYSPGGQAVDKVGVKPDVVTAKESELDVSHRAQLIAQWQGYKAFPKLTNVPVAKTFQVEMNAEMDWSKLKKGDVQLIQLGGGESAVAVSVTNERTVTVTPTKPLVAGKSYMLVIHPNWKGVNHHSMKKGIYVDVTVK
ncbi:S41 family peptidase [Sporosarcina beigongshangi]|uniref:S41 family peptidase n=1 Tax=Sporosarcina beigongshangi TaxID=2782538 RepID=UPI00193A918D|nr:S41 family peptidase [Sporosarcina beigongshangi]